MAATCFNLSPLPAGTPPPSCGATGFLCSQCPRTCGFCAAADTCIDKLPADECAPHRRTAGKTRQGNTSLGHGFCGVLSAGATPRWVIDPTTLDVVNKARPRSALRARRCLAGRRVVFLGDSNTRYQYLALAMALSSGAYPTQPRGGGFNICHEGGAASPGNAFNRKVSDRHSNLGPAYLQLVDPAFASGCQWEVFWNKSSAALGGAEVCECTTHRTFVHENRWYDDGTAQLAYLKGTPTIHSLPSLVGEWGKEAHAGGFGAVRAGAVSACLPPSTCTAKPVALTKSFAELATHLTRILRPGDVLVVGPGPWYSPDPRLADDLRTFMRSIAAHLGPTGKAIFKTCPRGSVLFTADLSRETRGCGNGIGCDATWRAVLPDSGWTLLDAFAMTDEMWRFGGPFAANRSGPQGMQLRDLRGNRTTMYTDNFHFRCGIYAELNEQLLDLVCPATSAQPSQHHR